MQRAFPDYAAITGVSQICARVVRDLIQINFTPADHDRFVGDLWGRDAARGIAPWRAHNRHGARELSPLWPKGDTIGGKPRRASGLCS